MRLCPNAVLIIMGWFLQVLQSLRLFRIGHISLAGLCLLGAIAQIKASKVGVIEIEKYE